VKNLNEESVRERVETVLRGLKDNRYGLHLAEGGIHCIDGRWWVVLETSQEPDRRSEIWDSIALIEELLDESDLKIAVTAA